MTDGSAHSDTVAMNEPSNSQGNSGTPGESGKDGARTDKKRSSCQEKNRQAQARFRQRQKAKASETEQKMSNLEAAVKQLRQEKEALQSRADALETQLHQGQHAALQHVALQHAPQQHVAQQPAPSQLTMQQPLGAAMHGGMDHMAWLADKRSTGSAGFEVVLPTVSPMAWDSYVIFYKDQIHKMAPLLAPAQADPRSEAAHTCERLLKELSEANRAIFHRSPALRDKVHTQPLVESADEPHVQPDVNLWRQVTAALQMLPEQKRHARALHSYYFSRMRAIMSDRHRLSAVMLGTCELAADMEMPGTTPWHRNQDVASKHSKALEAIIALNKNVAEETLAQIEVGHGLFCKVLTPLQACSAYVGLYPFFPDKLAILSCVLELDDSEDAVRSLVSELVGN